MAKQKENKLDMIMKNKSGKFAPLWIFVGLFIFIFLIALIEPMKPFLNIAESGLSCASTTNNYLLPVCWLVKGGIVLFIGTVLYSLVTWVIAQSK